MKRELPPIAKQAMRILVALEESTGRFQRKHKYLLGAELRDQADLAALRNERDAVTTERDLLLRYNGSLNEVIAERDGLREALTRAAENMKVAAEFHDCVNCGDGEKQARAALAVDRTGEKYAGALAALAASQKGKV